MQQEEQHNHPSRSVACAGDRGNSTWTKVTFVLSQIFVASFDKGGEADLPILLELLV